MAKIIMISSNWQNHIPPLEAYDILIPALRSEADSISLVQDASAGWLCVRGSCCGQSLVSDKGVLGVFPISELGQAHAFKVKEATIKIIDEFAKPAAPMPYSKKERILSLRVDFLQLKVMCYQPKTAISGFKPFFGWDFVVT